MTRTVLRVAVALLGTLTLVATFAAQAMATARSASSPACNTTLPAGTVVGMAVTSDALGYWIASSTGQVAACGDAAVLGNGPAGTAAVVSAPSGGRS